MKISTACLLCLAACAAAAQPARQDPPNVEELQRAWLQCDRAAAVALLDAGTAAVCSVLNEQLLHRVFGGDFDRLLAWWRSQNDKGAPPAPLPAAGARPTTR